ncbi:hypothetical protein K3495_g4703 [Podosphaera aphanis]|nr:hypothetical protein K3495_g4703 [Podosphaera aphanis]
MFSLSTTILCLTALVGSVKARYVFYYDQYHPIVPDNTINAGIDHVIVTFANSSLFTTNPPGEYKPFQDIPTVRSHFDPGTKVLVAIGGWGDTIGFGIGLATEESRKLYAANIAALLEKLGLDGVDIDMEYPGGNGEDYRKIPNSDKVGEIETYPLLLAEIRAAIGPGKLLTIATPGKKGDMIAYTPEKAPSIWASVDWVNVMTYDLMNRRDTVTSHHSGIRQSLEIIDYYINDLRLDPQKINLGFSMYAKWFTLDLSVPCENGLGCKTALLENPNGTDTGLSGAITFEASNYAGIPNNLTESTDTSCGPTSFHFCAANLCCSQYGFCGDTPSHCTGCQGPAYGSGCTTPSITSLFQTAMANGIKDEAEGGQYYFDRENKIFWTWDTPELIARKFTDIVAARNLGGVMAWSLGEDSFDFSHILALQRGVAERKSAQPRLRRKFRWM